MRKVKSFLNGEFQEEYESVVMASEELGVNESSIRKAIKRKGICCNLSWEYSEESPIEEEMYGEEERKPKFEDLGASYIVYYGKNQSHNVRIDKTKLQSLMDLFCVARMTVNACTYELDLSRREFMAIKTAFDITHDSIPLLNEDVDSKTTEEIADAIRIKKKRYALKQFESQKYKDQSKELDKFNKNDYWYKTLVERLDKIDPTPFDIKPVNHVDQDYEYIVNLADVHSGLIVENPWNIYNISVMRKRFEELTENIMNEIPVGRVHIAELGDSVHGLIHGSTRKYSEDMLTSAHAITECLAKMMLTLLTAGYQVVFTKVNGSHSSIEKVKDNRTDEENIGRTILWALQFKLGDVPNISFVEPISNMSLFKIFDYHVAFMHGDQASLIGFGKIRNLFPHSDIIEVNCGHIHHRKIEDLDGITILYNEAFCGSDQYSIGKLLHSQRGVRWAKYDKLGRKGEEFIRL